MFIVVITILVIVLIVSTLHTPSQKLAGLLQILPGGVSMQTATLIIYNNVNCQKKCQKNTKYL